MSLSSDAIVKQEIIDSLGTSYRNVQLRIFRQSSNQDQLPFSKGGLTFGYAHVYYGSCDAAWFIDAKWTDGYDGTAINEKPLIALEGTDALNRGSSGNAQTQRFHHVLGAVKDGIIGVYYLRKGSDKIRPDLFGMAYFASKVEKGKYLIIDDLVVVKNILNVYDSPAKCLKYINDYMEYMYSIFQEYFQRMYEGSWQNFADARSTIIKKDYVIKYAARSRRNFTDASQRAGHIAVGEMYLTRYYFYGKKFYYLFLRMSDEDLEYLDEHKSDDKEWRILRHEPDVEIKTVDDIIGLTPSIKDALMTIKDKPIIGGSARSIYNKCVDKIVDGLKSGTLQIKH